ncbi:hypothetical protein B0H17DRAFT_1125661 [Mycena rosella]|uniref:Uncharacterized protein n=1 Tax=Mycena rosella TaxID=1033263 RepID=A0AAD7GWM4_MYCRO|nr:hypothetical protein B0H17DRAFT_1125661 [Mycena rosella]
MHPGLPRIALLAVHARVTLETRMPRDIYISPQYYSSGVRAPEPALPPDTALDAYPMQINWKIKPISTGTTIQRRSPGTTATESKSAELNPTSYFLFLILVRAGAQLVGRFDYYHTSVLNWISLVRGVVNTEHLTKVNSTVLGMAFSCQACNEWDKTGSVARGKMGKFGCQ